MTSIAVVGVGNSLLQDDGAGIHVLAYYAQQGPADDVECLDAGTIGLALMERLAGRDGVIALDAMRLGKKPGSLTVLQGADMDAHLLNHHGSVHELGLSDIMDALRLSGQLPRRRALIGIEPAAMGWGTEPTAAVAAVIPAASNRIRQLLDEWRSPTDMESPE